MVIYKILEYAKGKCMVSKAGFLRKGGRQAYGFTFAMVLDCRRE